MKRIKKMSTGEYVWIGEVDLGVLGQFVDDMIVINLDGLEDDSSEDVKIEKLSDYNEKRFNQLSDVKDSLNEQFMMWMVKYLCDIEYPFWNRDSDQNYPSYISKREIEKYEDSNGLISVDIGQPNPIYREIREYDVYKNTDNLKSYEIVEKYLPILDFMKMVQTIQPECLSIYEEEINFQVGSDICNGLLFCATYGTIDINNKLVVTNNC